MTWWDAVKNWFAGNRSGSFPVPGEGTSDRKTEYNGATEWLAKRANLTTVMNSREDRETESKLRCKDQFILFRHFLFLLLLKQADYLFAFFFQFFAVGIDDNSLDGFITGHQRRHEFLPLAL